MTAKILNWLIKKFGGYTQTEWDQLLDLASELVSQMAEARIIIDEQKKLLEATYGHPDARR